MCPDKLLLVSLARACAFLKRDFGQLKAVTLKSLSTFGFFSFIGIEYY